MTVVSKWIWNTGNVNYFDWIWLIEINPKLQRFCEITQSEPGMQFKI